MKAITSTHKRTSRRWLVVNHLQTRFPWLLKLHEIIERERCSGSDALIACSALKHLYRQILLHGSTAVAPNICPHHISPSSPEVFFLYLLGDYDLIHQRMVARQGHYMKADMLRSQFDILEPPSDEENVLTLDIRRSLGEMVLEVEKHIESLKLKLEPLQQTENATFLG
ncbi:probable gluconokinase isoform X2 [Girardinichthys multiradiatus]|uniref:probable gluconokinase isoform X2 n=1 Tax=Girardinichthys multiradiatus TaxID=208333 RepID=UPI001FAB85D3|nr:probable gluconokinase isoform X2 [Girardinichthys multiradiatus]XP_047238354.1 probable gluconokinase isoform X2 [Girardinichthys multiradiatus]XP_047238355.1 probable gluconokinase isoform X2 [Girardinichthys multiradiatus]